MKQEQHKSAAPSQQLAILLLINRMFRVQAELLDWDFLLISLSEFFLNLQILHPY